MSRSTIVAIQFFFTKRRFSEFFSFDFKCLDLTFLSLAKYFLNTSHVAKLQGIYISFIQKFKIGFKSHNFSQIVRFCFFLHHNLKAHWLKSDFWTEYKSKNF